MVFHQVVIDDALLIKEMVRRVVGEARPDILLVTGGTGLNPTDVTIETLRPLFEKELTAFGSLFALLSFEEIDSAAILSRATAGIIQRTTVFCLPGSLNACRLACKALIFPEAGHIAAHVNKKQ